MFKGQLIICVQGHSRGVARNFLEGGGAENFKFENLSLSEEGFQG